MLDVIIWTWKVSRNFFCWVYFTELCHKISSQNYHKMSIEEGRVALFEKVLSILTEIKADITTFTITEYPINYANKIINMQKKTPSARHYVFIWGWYGGGVVIFICWCYTIIHYFTSTLTNGWRSQRKGNYQGKGRNLK